MCTLMSHHKKCTIREMVVEESYMEMDFIRNRITELRVKREFPSTS